MVAGCALLHAGEDDHSAVAGDRRDSQQGSCRHACHAITAHLPMSGLRQHLPLVILIQLVTDCNCPGCGIVKGTVMSNLDGSTHSTHTYIGYN